MYIEKFVNTNMIEKILNKFPNASFTNEKVNFFTDVKEEYNSLKYGVGILFWFNREILSLIGKDSLDFLYRISTSDLKNLQKNYRAQTLFLNEKGRFVDRATLLYLESKILLISGFQKDNRLFSWINKFIISEDIQTSQATNEYSVLDIIGPQAESFLTLLIGDELKSLNGDNIISVSLEGIDFFLFSIVENNKSRFYRILLSSSQLNDFCDFVMNNKSVFDLNFIGEDTYNIYRVENAIVGTPNEINFDTNPYETNLLQEVSFKKGCYIGQEVIARIETYDKVQNRLCGFIFSDKCDLELPISVFDDMEVAVGRITSTANSYLFEKQIGLGFVKRKSVLENGNYYVLSDSKKKMVKIVELPFTK
jgi:folate-binding protein YgfZ